MSEAEGSPDSGRSRWAMLVREPLLHFFALALVAVGARSYFSSGDEPDIVIDQALVDGLRRLAPAGEEASNEALVDTWLREELLFQEALALGLERGDEIVRRRLILKMETLLSIVDDEPSDEELRAYLEEHEASFTSHASLTLEHIFFSQDRRENAEADAQGALRAIQASQATPDGDAFLLGSREVRRSPEDLDGRFGEGFGAAVSGFDRGTWAGPVQSRFGFHLVRITERHEAAATTLSDARAAVTAAWRADAQNARLAAAIDELRERASIERRLEAAP